MSMIHTIRDNMINTIKNKQKMLDGIGDVDQMFNMEARMVAIATREFLKINIGELKRILIDIEVAVTEADAK
jgi:hypothetical protein